MKSDRHVPSRKLTMLPQTVTQATAILSDITHYVITQICILWHKSHNYILLVWHICDNQTRTLLFLVLGKGITEKEGLI